MLYAGEQLDLEAIAARDLDASGRPVIYVGEVARVNEPGYPTRTMFCQQVSNYSEQEGEPLPNLYWFTAIRVPQSHKQDGRFAFIRNHLLDGDAVPMAFIKTKPRLALERLRARLDGMGVVPKSAKTKQLVLKPECQDVATDFESEFRFRGCTCFISPPCIYCMHEGNPLNLEGADDAWMEVEDGVELGGEA